VACLSEFHKPPFECKNEGWGEFELTVDMFYTEKTKITIPHDLNFSQERYESISSISFKNPSRDLQEKLRELGPLPMDEERAKKKASGATKKTAAQKWDLEKIADALEKLDEDDLLTVIGLINDHKNAETYIRSDADGMYSGLTSSRFNEAYWCSLLSCFSPLSCRERISDLKAASLVLISR
jgi:transcription initiation factor TFIID/TFIIF subunit